MDVDDNILYHSKIISQEKELAGHKKRVYSVDWNCDGSRLASGSYDCSIKVRISYNFFDMGC